MTRILVCALVALLAACGDEIENGDAGAGESGETAPTGVLPEGLPEGGVGSCSYVNPFSELAECKQYIGEGWTEASAREDCSAVFAGEAGQFELAGHCDFWPNTGACLVEPDSPTGYYTLLSGDASLCETLDAACESFARGELLTTPGGPCDDGGGPGDGVDPNGSLQPEALAAMRSGEGVDVFPECLDDTCLGELVDASEAIYFAPSGEDAATGLIVYPGGGVDARAYAVAARAIAEQGYLVALVPMPDGLAINGVDRGEGVMAAWPEIETWAIAGHSLGGSVAARFALTHTEAISGLALWASYLSDDDDLSGLEMATVTIYGDIDPRVTPEDALGSLPRLPADTLQARIRGGNHSYFAWAGMLEGDVEAELIDQDQQTELAIGATLHMLLRAEAGFTPEHRPGYDEAAALEAADGCAILQQQIGAFPEGSLARDDIENVRREGFRDFWSADLSLPHTTPGSSPSVHVYQYTRQIPNATDIAAPPILDGELFCKVRSQEAILTELGDAVAEPLEPQQECHRQTALALQWALETVAPEIREAAESWSTRYEEDRLYATGPDFMQAPDSYVEVLPGDEPRSTVVRARAFRAGLDADEWGRAAGNTYCKALSYQNALWRIYARAEIESEPWTPPALSLEGGPLVLARDQTVGSGEPVNVEQVVYDRDGFIVVHEDFQGGAGIPLGFSALVPAGANANIAVPLSRPIRDGETLHAMLHTDGDGDGVYDTTSDIDGPVLRDDGSMIMAPFVVRLAQ